MYCNSVKKCKNGHVCVPLSNHDGTCYATARMNQVRQLRESRHLTQVQRGLLLGVQPAALGRWERGEVLPRKRMRRQLARQLGVTEEELAFDQLANEGDDD
jgi:transcriptional regulator with XRE-family HTH domain